MTYQAGSAVSYYILDITDAERKAAQLRSIYQGIRQDAASLSSPVVASSGGNSGAQTAAIRTQTQVTQQATSATQALIQSTIELGAAQGLTTDEINAQFAAMSREALAAGDLAAANELIDASLGRIVPQETAVLEVRKSATQTVEQQANAELRLAQQQARTLAAQRDNVGAIQLLNNAKNNAVGANAQLIASTETQIATLERTATAGGAVGTAFTSMLSPVVLATAAIGGAIVTFKAFNDALDFEGKLSEERRAFEGIIGDFTKGDQVLQQAVASGKEFGFTEKEITDAFKQLAPIIKESTSSTNDQAGALERISVINPANPVQALSSAIEGIKAGRFIELRKELGLTQNETELLKQSVNGGKDVFIALNEVLDQHGITLNVARDRMTGYEGAARRAAQAEEDLKKAQADLAQNTTGFVDLETQFTTGLTRFFGGLGGLTEGLRQLDAQAVGNRAGQEAYNKAIVEGKDETDAQAIALRAAQVAASNYVNEGKQTVQVLQREADADDRYTASTYKAVIATDALTHAQYQQNQQQLQDQRAGERSGGLFDTLNEVTSAYDKQHTASKEAYQDAQNLRDAQLSYANATNDTATQRKILNQELKDAAGDEAKQLTIKAQIAQLDKQKNTASKGLSGLDRTDIKLAGDYQDQLNEVNRRLANGHLTQQQRNQLLLDQIDLQNKINDAVQKESDLQIGIDLDNVHNQQKLIEETRELAGLRRAEGDSRFSAEQQQAIRLREQEILLEQQKRNNDLTKEQNQLAQTVKQSGIGAVPAGTTGVIGSIPVSQIPPIGSGLPVASSGVPQARFAPGEKFIINLTVNVDKNGVASVVQPDPSVALNLISRAFGAQVASGGLP